MSHHVCRVRQVHIRGMSKRYSQLGSEKRHLEQLASHDVARLVSLAAAMSALGESILICDFTIDLSHLKPIRYRLREPLPGTALTRARLSALRTARRPLDANELFDAICTKACARF